MQQIFNLDLNNYQIEKVIGQGNYGKVYLVHKENNSEEHFAAKESTNVISQGSELLENLLQEIKIIAQMNHPSIIRFIGFNRHNFKKEENPIIITEYCSRGSLSELLDQSYRSNAPHEFDDTQKIIILYGIASAMNYLHKNGIIHRDLKPANILLDDELNPKICDFGLSIFLHKNTSSDQLAGTPLYLAPEIIDKCEYTEKCDVYAFALIAYEMILNEKPFKNETNFFKLSQKVMKGERPEFLGPIEESYRALIEKCWSQNPADRPTFEEVVHELKDDPGFITDMIDEGRYYDYIDFLDSTPASLKNIPDFSEKDFDNLDPVKMLEYAKYKEEIERDFVEARRCYKLAGDLPTDIKFYSLENTEGMLNYARCCKKGIGGNKDMDDYVKYVKMAADSNNGKAQYRYGLLLENGKNVEKNLKEAAKYFKAASELFENNAMIKYINYLLSGIGVKKNVYKALKCCTRLIYFREKSSFKKKTTKEKKLYNVLLRHMKDDDYINDDDYVNDTKNDDNINMKDHAISFKGKKTIIINDYYISGKEDLIESLKRLNEYKMNIYPQGFDYCVNLLNQQMNNNGIVLNCSSLGRPKRVVFYFNLAFDEGQQIYLGTDLIAEIDRVKARGNKDVYPQGINYCLDLLKEQHTNNGCVRILSKKIGPNSRRVFYYFKSYYNAKFPRNQTSWETVYFVQGKDALLEKISEMHKNKNENYKFIAFNPKPVESFDSCVKVLHDALDKNDFALVLENKVYALKQVVVRCFSSKMFFHNLCEEEWFVSGEGNLKAELNKLVHSDDVEYLPMPNHSNEYPQGKENCIKLVEEQIKCGGKIHIFKRKNNYSSCCWFYLKA